jgi:hypothetical protein
MFKLRLFKRLNPPAKLRDTVQLYADLDGSLKTIDDAGVVSAVGSGGNGGGGIRVIKSPLITKDTPNLAVANDPQPHANPVLFSVANGDFAVDDVIVDMWASVLEFFDGPDNAVLHIAAETGPVLSPDWNWELYGQVDPDLAFDDSQNNASSPTGAGLAVCDGNALHGQLDVRTANALNPGTQRILPATVLTEDLRITVALANGTTWTQGQMYVYALVATPS